MSTGITCRILEGQSFESFVWTCARSFGPLVGMRDSAADEPIVILEESIGDVPGHEEVLEGAKVKLAALESRSDDEWEILIEEKYQEERARKVARNKVRLEEKKVYEAMLRKAQAWEPPSKDHLGIKSLMIEQVRSTIEHDCSVSGYHDPDTVKRISRKDEVASAMAAVTRCQDALVMARRSAKFRSTWLQVLESSVPRPPHLVPESER